MDPPTPHFGMGVIRKFGPWLLLMSLSISGCGGDGGSTAPPIPEPVASVQITSEFAVIDSGKTVQLVALVRSATGLLLSNRPISWSAKDPLVVSISSTGLVLGKAAGVGTVVAEAEGVRDTSVVFVTHVVPEALWGISTPTAVSGGIGFAYLWAGQHRTCALDLAGRAYCWGGGSTEPRLPTRVPGDLTFASIAPSNHLGGGTHVCALDPSGAAFCWGNNQFGQLGNGTTATTVVPTPVAGGLAFVQLSTGQFYTCGISTAGVAYCWGENFAGALGDGTLTDRATPTRVSGAFLFTAITTGDDHTCALTAAGDAYCWGENDDGELGVGSVSSGFLTPQQVQAPVKFTSISAGAEHVCALSTPGTAYCWGWNIGGQLGRTGGSQALPGEVSGGLAFTAISAGSFHTCALAGEGKAYCWGRQGFGVLGNGLPSSGTISATPVAVVGGHAFASISSGASHVCALTVAQVAYCWGHNENGALGIP